MKTIALFLLSVLAAFGHDWRKATVSATGGTYVTDSGHRLTTVTLTVFDDSDTPWRKWVIDQDAFQGKTKVQLPQGATFKVYCNGVESSTLRSTWVVIQYKDAKGHNKEEMHNLIEGAGDRCY